MTKKLTREQAVADYVDVLNDMSISVLATEWIALQDSIATARVAPEHLLRSSREELLDLSRKNDLLLAVARAKFDDVAWMNAVDAAC
jgi:hypothetical protein